MSHAPALHPKDSPAVKSLRKEQAREKAKSPEERDQELVRGLKDTFPASDPVSATNTTTSGEPSKKAD